MSWYKEGAEGVEAVKEDDEQRKALFDAPRRFWLKPDTSTKVCFLDTKGFFYKEHQFYRDGHWRNWETCISDISEEDCPPCEAGHKYSYNCAFSIIDLTKYTDKKGNKVTASKKLLILKAGARNKVLKQKERRDNDLAHCVFDVTRFTKKECSTGEDFEFLKRATADELKELCPAGENPDEWLTPFNYLEMFQPKSAEELRKLVGVAPPVGSEDVPFDTNSNNSKGEGSDKKALKDLL